MDKTILEATGLRLFPRNRTAALVATLSCVLGVTIFILILDGLLFRRSLPDGYEALFTAPLLPRTLVSCTGSMIEEIQYRLLLMTALTIMATALYRKPLPAWAMLLIIGVAQSFNVHILLWCYPVYGALRYWLVGCVWGVLYWRHGFLAALAGHGAAHLLLDPAVRQMLLLTQ